MSRRVYVTQCSARKDMSLKDSHNKVTPEVLYTSTRIQRFMKTCKKKDVAWAIFSDKYGIWNKNIKKSW